MKQKKFNRASDTMKQLYKAKDIKGLIDFKNNYPVYSLKAECYILRIQKGLKNELTIKENDCESSNIIISGVYFLYDKGELVYVGQSKNILARIHQHKDKVFDTFNYLEIEDEKKRNDKEIDLIMQHTPKYNKSIPTFYESDVLLINRLKNVINDTVYEEIKSLINIKKIGSNTYFTKSEAVEICKQMLNSLKDK